jgi:hypothetical protein
MKTSKEKLTYLIEKFARGNTSEFGRLIDKSPSTLFSVLNERNDLSAQMIQSICTKFPQVNKDWLLFDIGNPILDEVKVKVEVEPTDVRQIREENSFLKKQVEQLNNQLEQMTSIVKSLTMSMGKFRANVFPAVYGGLFKTHFSLLRYLPNGI